MKDIRSMAQIVGGGGGQHVIKKNGAINTSFLPLWRPATHGKKEGENSDFSSPKLRGKHQIL